MFRFNVVLTGRAGKYAMALISKTLISAALTPILGILSVNQSGLRCFTRKPKYAKTEHADTKSGNVKTDFC